MIELVRAALADVAFARQLYELTGTSFDVELVLDDAEIIAVDNARVGWLQSSVHGTAIHLAQLHVAPAWRGRGIGRAAVERVIERARVAHRDVTLAVLAASPARRLYERLGFVSDRASVAAGDTIYLRRQRTSV